MTYNADFCVERPSGRPRSPRALLDSQSIVWPAGPYAVEICGRKLAIGDVYAVHPQATAINGDESDRSSDAGDAEDFEVHFRPGDDPYFYLTLANEPPEAILRRSLRAMDSVGSRRARRLR